MKNVLILLLLLLPVTAFCWDRKDNKKPKPMPVSRWREVTRISPDSLTLSFSDTLFIAFRKNDSATFHNKYGFVYNATYRISEDSVLDFGYARYQIRLRKPKSLIISDKAGTYYLEPDWTDTVKAIVLDTSQKFLPVTDVDQMIGRWSVYKRTSDEPVSSDGENIIRSVYITGASTDGRQGVVFSSKDPQNVPSWHITRFADQMLSADGRSPKSLKVIKCQGGEMILQDGGVKYYFKQFK